MNPIKEYIKSIIDLNAAFGLGESVQSCSLDEVEEKRCLDCGSCIAWATYEEDTEKSLKVNHDKEDCGDISFNCYKLAKKLKRDPEEVAQKLLEIIVKNNEEFNKKKLFNLEKMYKYKLIDRMERKGSYINFVLNTGELARMIIPKIYGTE
jgi:arginyl-tRNA synthetase